MGYKRCLPANEFEDSSISKPKRFACNSELTSFADVDTPNSAFVKPAISGKWCFLVIFCFCFTFLRQVCFNWLCPD